MRSTKFVVIFIVLAVSFYVGCQPKGDASLVENSPKERTFVGSANCKSCHLQEYKLWEESHHFHAMEEPREQSVLGDFDNAEFKADGVEYLFFQNGNQYVV